MPLEMQTACFNSGINKKKKIEKFMQFVLIL